VVAELEVVQVQVPAEATEQVAANLKLAKVITVVDLHPNIKARLPRSNNNMPSSNNTLNNSNTLNSSSTPNNSSTHRVIMGLLLNNNKSITTHRIKDELYKFKS
jgi:hypothetical protein